MNYKLIFILFVISISNGACVSNSMDTVEYVDVENFMGDWFEIASLPTTFNKNCTCSKVAMELNKESGYVKVINSCVKNDKQGAVLAKAFIDNSSGNAKWKMQLFWPFKSDYFILKLADDYSYAVVGNPDYSQLQILCRTADMPDNDLNDLISFAGSLGYDIEIISRTIQNCN